MRQEKSDQRFWVIGLLVVAGVFGGIYVLTGETTVKSAVLTAPAVERAAQPSSALAQPTPATDADTELAASVATPEVAIDPPQHAEPVIARIYECMINGQRVFSDQVCAADARQRDIAAPNSMAAQEAAIGYRSSGMNSGVVRKRAAAAASANDDAKRSHCAALLQDKDYLNSRMRAGYTNNQGERLRARLRKIDSEYYDLRCRALH